jgi:hypothetical protein
LGLGALAAAGAISDIAYFTGLGTGPSLAGKAALTTARAARIAAKVGDAAKLTKVNKAADAASDSALIRRITSGKKKGDDTPPAAGGQEIIQGNTRLKPTPDDFRPTKTDNKIDVPTPANDLGPNVTSLPPRTTQVTPSNPNTKIGTPGQGPANVNATTFKPASPVTNIKPNTAANQTGAPTRTKTDNETAPRTDKDNETAPSNKADNRKKPDDGDAPTNRPKGGKPKARPRPKLRLSLPTINTVFDSNSAAGQASGVGTYMHKAGAPLRVSEENEADKARTSIENVARLNSRKDKAVKQQEIQKKILDEKKSLADTVKRNVEEVRTKQKVESPIITNPELKRPEPEGINNVR